MEEAIIHTDGGSRGNPGPAAYAYTLEVAGQPLIEEKCYMGHTTNNVAEYTGVVKALEHAKELGVRRIILKSDSELMVKQMTGIYRVKHDGLIPLYKRAIDLTRAFEKVTFQHVRREYNKHADRLCNEAMDERSSGRKAPALDAHPTPLASAPVVPLSPPPVTVESKPVEEPPKKRVARVDFETVQNRGYEILLRAAAEWGGGSVPKVAVGEVWLEIWEMLRETGAIKKK